MNKTSWDLPKLTQELTQLLDCEVRTDPAEFGVYIIDESQMPPEGDPLAVIFPTETVQVSQALKWANSHKIPVSVRGGGTGLAGGAVAYPGGLVISLDRMNKILNIDVENKLADIQPGVITAELDAAANELGLFFAPDPASAATSTVGGNIATNAGGLRCVAHGVTLESVAALEVVLANGEVIHTGGRTVKNVSGLNLTQLFVGSEGTLGIITGATVRLKKAPAGDPFTFSAHFDTMAQASQAILEVVNNGKPESLELVDAPSAAAVEKHFPSGLKIPKAAIVLGLCVGEDAQEKAQVIAEICTAGGAVETAVVKGHELLNTRRQINPAMTIEKVQIFGDVGVPISKLPEMCARLDEISERTGKRIFMIAHAGDGNLHPSVESGNTPEEYAAGQKVLDEIVVAALELGGTITGEHGIGALKHHELPLQFTPQTLAAQRTIKDALDPNGILTPGRGI
ncbi:MAG: FAD-linked oxidase C-terminal domain-containing protein [Rothia sp. (in: high G+C Gram-positive bacteria)]|nr:FAD-linked oxidase C-terminal domain-containing protein [Rothia sp. (in: high G+C Gram-positive bacteria)]